MFKVRVEVRLGPAELVFLLEDMLRKLDFRLTAGPAKKAPFLKVQPHPPKHLQMVNKGQYLFSEDFSSCRGGVIRR